MTNFYSGGFDWQFLKEYIRTIESLENGNTIPQTDELNKYVRLQRFLREHSHISEWSHCRNKVIEMAVEFHLSPHKATLLYLALQKTSSRFAFGSNIESYQRAADAFKPLKGIQLSLNRLASLSEKIIANNPKPQMRIVEKKLENAAHFWAAEKLKHAPKSKENDNLNEIKSYGFEHTRFGDDSNGYGDDYDSFVVVRQWLRTNVLMNQLVKKILTQSETNRANGDVDSQIDSSGLHWLDNLSEIERLVGHILPNLYERVTGQTFKLKQNKIQQYVLVEGAKFVSMAMVAIQLSETSAENIASHHKAVWKVKASKK